MSQQALDLRNSVQIVRRHKIVVGIFAVLGLLVSVGLTLYYPPMLTSDALVTVVLPASEQGTTTQNGTTTINAALATQIVIAESSPVLNNALRNVHPSISLQTLQSRLQVTSLAGSDVLSIHAEGKTAAQAEATANAVASSYVAVSNSPHPPGGPVEAAALGPATAASGPSLLSPLLLFGCLGALLGALAGAFVVLAFNRSDRRLRERDEIADSIGVPVLASINAVHPAGAAGWAKLLAEYKPGSVDSWRLRKSLQHLGLAEVNPSGSQPDGGLFLEVISLGFDSGALSLGPQVAVFAASRGIQTALIAGPHQDVSAAATLRAACATPPAPPGLSSRLRVIVEDHDDDIPPPDATLTVLVTVVDGRNPQFRETKRNAATVLGVSAGAATAEQIARVAANAAAAGREITGILVADPDPADHTTGRIPQLARSAHRTGPTRTTGTTTEATR